MVGSPQRGAAAPVPGPEAEVRAPGVLPSVSAAGEPAVYRQRSILPAPRVAFAGPAMLSLDFLDDVRRMNKRQVRLAAPFPRAALVPPALPLRGPADLWSAV